MEADELILQIMTAGAALAKDHPDVQFAAVLSKSPGNIAITRGGDDMVQLGLIAIMQGHISGAILRAIERSQAPRIVAPGLSLVPLKAGG